MDRCIAVAATALALIAAAPFTDDASKKELERFQGSWELASLEINGNQAGEDSLSRFKLLIKDDRWTVSIDDKDLVSTVKADPSKKPHQIEFTPQAGEDMGKPIHGIYEIKGDLLKMCRNLRAEKERPTEFASQADSGLILVVWKRAKSK